MSGVGDARERILRVAEAQFLAHGLGGVTMDDIAAELRMSKKTLYQHFPSKDALCVAAIERAMANLDAELEQAIAREAASFDELLARVAQIVATRLKGTGPLLQELSQDAPALYERLQTLRQEVIYRRPGAWIAQGMSSGALRDDVRPELIVRILLTLAHHIIEPKALSELGLDPSEAHRQMMSVILDGIRVRAPAPLSSSRAEES
ncbi:TetR/AcrR family transcriptional regulator [Chondromyces crocatus]|uniref:HTH tetR-type domain-containing protein n=1 Tax=Chondromyces crocatus TaxID=52 RepID=A0A0K1E750_CHOCO|nr:TetR/AcrR family transcriptional regulator [Chondromyces crocatus]AKT36701.1 uncharacterized protein CMC5_008220 [Chondromyces crocatus]